MKLFHLTTRQEQSEEPAQRIWLVIAETLAEAKSFVPKGYVLEAVEAGWAYGGGPARVIGWMGAPLAQ